MTVIKATSPVELDEGPSLVGQAVLVVEDGPTITHGGLPFGALLGDYELRHRPSPDNPTDDIRPLLSMSSVAAAAFAPFIAGAHPNLLELDSLADLEQPLDLFKLGALCAETGARAFACNATEPEEVERLFGLVDREIATPDVVVYNASGRAISCGAYRGSAICRIERRTPFEHRGCGTIHQRSQHVFDRDGWSR